MEDDAFNDLLERHACCDVAACRCPDGPNSNQLDTLVISHYLTFSIVIITNYHHHRDHHCSIADNSYLNMLVIICRHQCRHYLSGLD